jgi:hypothetical protein
MLCSTRASPGRNRRAGFLQRPALCAPGGNRRLLRFLVSPPAATSLLLLLVYSGRRGIRLPRRIHLPALRLVRYYLLPLRFMPFCLLPLPFAHSLAARPSSQLFASSPIFLLLLPCLSTTSARRFWAAGRSEVGRDCCFFVLLKKSFDYLRSFIHSQ